MLPSRLELARSEAAAAMAKVRINHQFFRQNQAAGTLTCKCGLVVIVQSDDPWDDFEVHRSEAMLNEIDELIVFRAELVPEGYHQDGGSYTQRYWIASDKPAPPPTPPDPVRIERK